jgi:hypothetical protein
MPQRATTRVAFCDTGLLQKDYYPGQINCMVFHPKSLFIAEFITESMYN